MLARASSFNGSPAAILFASELVSVESLQKAMTDDNVVGIIIAYGKPPAGSFSPAEKIPNGPFGQKTTHEWNPNGNGWALADLKKPWFSLNANDTVEFLSRLKESESRGSRLAVEFKLQMKTSTDSETCLRRGWCKDVGGVSLIASLSTVETLKSSPELIAVMASVDSNAIMQTRAPGAVSDMSGAVALVAAFQALGNVYNNATCQRPSVFHLFNAEAWGYTGSKRFVQHMVEGHGIYWNSSVWALLEAKQVGSKTASAKLTVHAPNNAASDALAAEMARASERLQVPLTRFAGTASTGLPPASLQSFLLKLPPSQSVGAAVLTDHGAVYENQYYQSMFDTFDNADPTMVCNAAKVLAETVAALQVYAEPKPIVVNCTFVAELLGCLSKDWRCPLFVSYLPFMANAPDLPSNYAGVFMGTENMRPTIKVSQLACYFGAPVSDAFLCFVRCFTTFLPKPTRHL